MVSPIDPNQLQQALLSLLGGAGGAGGAANSSQPDPTNNNQNQLQLVITTLANILQAISNLNLTMKNVFPQQGATATSATSGSASALPSPPAGYLDVVINGTPQKIPYYNN